MVQSFARPRRVTLADVARYAGVSTAVVSYVVNDGPRPVAADTADRVRAAVSVLGYRPNTHARALMTGSTGILGMIHPGTANPFFGEFADVLDAVATEAGIALLTSSSGCRPETERALVESLARRDVDGIIAVTSMTRGDVPMLRDPGVPVVLVNCPFPVPGYATIGPDSAEGARRVVDHLLRVHGHEGVALLAGQTGAQEPEERELGWREAHRAAARPAGPLVRTPFSLDGGYDSTRRLLKGPERPTAIFAASDELAHGALHAIHEQQLDVPDDIAVVSFDGTAGSAHSWPPLTVARQPLRAMAEAAVRTVLGGAAPAHSMIETTMVIRRSCGCPDPPPHGPGT